MENNKIIDKNPSNSSSGQGVSFASSNTPGFLISNNKKELNGFDEEKLKRQENLVQTNKTNTSLLRKQSIDVIEEAKNEFENAHTNNDALITDNNLLLVSQQSIVKNEQTEEVKTNTAYDNELINNPSSIFNIPLIDSAEVLSNPINNTLSDDYDVKNKDDNDDKEITSSAIITPNIDFFSFNFSTSSPNIEDNTPKKEVVIKNDDVIQVDFNSVIRASDNQEVIPEEDERVELTKFLEPRENIIKKPNEVAEDDNNVIRINDDSASDSYRNKNNIIKYSLYSFYVLLALLLLLFLYKMYKNHTGFSLTREEITLAINSTYQAEIVSNSKIQDNTKYEWSSSDTSIVTVDQNGLITSIGGGEATITVKKARQKKILKVTTVDIEIESITFEDKLIKLKVGEEKTLQPIINNDKTIVIDLLWETGDENIVTVDQNGHVIATGVGTVSIFVYDEVSGLGGEISIEVEPSNEVEPGNKNDKEDNIEKDKIAVTGIALNKSDTIMVIGEYIIVSAVVKPANATDKSITWSSSNKEVATVSSTGKVIAKNVGTTTITATTKNGKRASMKVTVTEKFIHVTSITLNYEKVTLEVGGAISLKATIKPTNATNKGVIWSSSDSTIAEVSNDGKVTAKSAGTTTITATTKDGNKKAVATITVKEKEIIPITDISLNVNTLNLDVGNTYIVEATIKPSNATIKTVEWSTTDPNVATVENGKITAVGAGSATITVTTIDGKKTATCIVTVKEIIVEPTGVDLNKTDITLTVGETFQLIATVKPSNATNKSLTWSSSKSSYASVSDTGLITAKKAGNTVITVKTANGKKRTCAVTIIEPETTPELPPDTGPETETEIEPT